MPPTGPPGLAPRRAVRIAGCSGAAGDRPSAARELVEGGPVDVLTATAGDAATFLSQLREVLPTCLARGIRIVARAGGPDPVGLAEEVEELAARLGAAPRIAAVTGRPRRDVDVPPAPAGASLGGWGIAEALTADADIVICPPLPPWSLVLGPAAWWHGWRRTDWDALAGAVAAGYVVGPGSTVCPEDGAGLLLPGLAEVDVDGSSVLTGHPGTGGVVSVAGVAARLRERTADPAYPTPDVVAHLDTVQVGQQAPDRVRLAGTRGSPPSAAPEVEHVVHLPDGSARTVAPSPTRTSV